MTPRDWFPDPTEWLAIAARDARSLDLAARLARAHHENLAGQGGDTPVTQEAACVSPPCAVIALDSRRRP